jgi:outer membrane protein OmpU
MKKIIAAAVATAFVAPAFAADITLSGSQEWNYQDNNGVTTSELDGTIKVTASSELPNGMSVSTSIALDEAGSADGGTSLTLSGDFGSVALGDVSGAVDAVDDVTDWGFEATSGSGGSAGATDAHVLWTLPTLAEGLTVNISASAGNSEGGGQDAEAEASGVSIKYAAGSFSVAYGTQDNDDGTSHSVVNATFATGGLTVGVEQFTDSSSASVDTDYKAMGAKYAMGDTTFFVENMTKSSSGTTSKDITAVGISHAVGDVTFFAETKDDAKVAATETTYFGASYSF